MFCAQLMYCNVTVVFFCHCGKAGYVRFVKFVICFLVVMCCIVGLHFQYLSACMSV